MGYHHLSQYAALAQTLLVMPFLSARNRVFKTEFRRIPILARPATTLLLSAAFRLVT
jgi:hypothetical protein